MSKTTEATLDKSQLITLRIGQPDDLNFVYSTWLKGLYYGDSWFSDIPKDIFMKKYHAVLDGILKRNNTTLIVACLKDDPDTILGYSVASWHPTDPGYVLHWAFVKSPWRRIGIGKSLMPPGVVSVSHLTKVGKALLPKIQDAVFDPFTL